MSKFVAFSLKPFDTLPKNCRKLDAEHCFECLFQEQLCFAESGSNKIKDLSYAVNSILFVFLQAQNCYVVIFLVEKK